MEWNNLDTLPEDGRDLLLCLKVKRLLENGYFNTWDIGSYKRSIGWMTGYKQTNSEVLGWSYVDYPSWVEHEPLEKTENGI